MNKFIIGKSFLLALLFVVVNFSAFGAESPYGKLTLQEGSAYLVREGKKITAQVGKELLVYNNDLIRLQDNSYGKLTSNEKATVELGSNALLKVRSWEDSNSKGFLNLLYGKIKATIAGLTGDESFNIRTANSVIGVKGTEYTAGTNEDGNSYAWTLDDYVYLSDVVRRSQLVVPSGYYISNFKDGGFQRMVWVGKEASIADITSSAPGIRDALSKTDQFFIPRPDLGSVPVLDLEANNQQVAKTLQEVQKINSANLIKVNFRFEAAEIR